MKEYRRAIQTFLSARDVGSIVVLGVLTGSGHEGWGAVARVRLGSWGGEMRGSGPTGTVGGRGAPRETSLKLCVRSRLVETKGEAGYGTGRQGVPEEW